MTVWFHQTQFYIHAADADGVVLETRRRGLHPIRRQLTVAEATFAIEFGTLRPA